MADIDLQKVDQATKDKYQIADNTFKVDVKPDVKDLVTVEIGDSKTTAEFLPQQKVQRWQNEANVSIRLVHDEKAPKVIAEDGKIKWLGDKVEAHFYDINNEEHPEGASEFEVVLKEKPKTNIVEFTVVDKNVDYFYQPALTAEEIKQGASRPENVVGSYAVYASEQKTNWTGGKEYKVGKVGHIFRPKIIDSAGAEVWGDLHIENGILSVTIPQEFLDKGIYPIIVDPTFGYTSGGAAFYNIARRYSSTGYFCFRVGQNLTPASAGTLGTISAYLSVTVNDTLDVSVFLNEKDSVAAGQHGQIAVVTNLNLAVTTTSTKYDFTMASESFTAVPHYLSISGDPRDIADYDRYAYVAYDSQGGAHDSPWISETYTTAGGGYPASLESPWVETSISSGDDEKYSIYATYTAGGGGAVTHNLSLLGVGT